MKKLFASIALFSLAFFVFPVSSHAYLTTDQNAFTLDDKMGIFLIDFSFGHQDHDVHIPVQAKFTAQKTTNSLSYSLYDDEDETAIGTATGIVLSNAPYKNGVYVVPAGSNASFTLFVAFSKGEKETESQFRAEVTNLPFSFSGTQQLQLNPSELKYYITDFLTLTSK